VAGRPVALKIGALDRRIVLQRRAGALTVSGQPFDVWNDIATRWASVAPLSGNERFSTPQLVAKEVVEILIRFSSATAGIHPGDRVVFPSSADPEATPTAVYNILAVHEVGRREGQKLLAERLPVPDSGIPDPFDPVLLGVRIWLDPSDLSTSFVDVAHTTLATPGDAVAALKNRGILGGFATQSTPSLRPILRASEGSRWLEYATGQFLELSHSSIAAPFDALLSWRITSGAFPPTLMFNDVTDRITAPSVERLAFGAMATAVGTLTPDADFVGTLFIAGNGGTSRLAVDTGAYVTATQVGAFSAGSSTNIGPRFDGGPSRMYGVTMGFASPLSESNIAKARGYHAGKQGRVFT